MSGAIAARARNGCCPASGTTLERASLVPASADITLGCGTESRPAFTEAAIASEQDSLTYVEEFLPEDDVLLDARRNASAVGGTVPVGPATGAALRFIAAAIGARSVVEIGTGCGTSGVWLLRGMRTGGVLTSVDVEPEHQRLARTAFLDAGFASSRFRLISGRALEVLPRLADGAYDMVFCDADKQEYLDYLTAALRLLRPGGIVAFDNALWHSRMVDALWRDRVSETAAADPDSAAVRELCEQVKADERLVPLLLPVGYGLLTAVKQTA
jgi:predicted O-methyltransferase YrrM